MSAEQKRLQALQQYDIIDTPAEEAFDNLAKLAAYICNTSVAQINFIGESRQWTKANVGWGKTDMPKEQSFCVHTIQSENSYLVINDTTRDKKFKEHPLTKLDPPVRFYAGIVIKSIEDYPLGTLCVYDSEPKSLSDKQMEGLKTLADEVEVHLSLRLEQEKLKENFSKESRLNKKIISSLPGNFFMYNSRGDLVRWNENLMTSTGYSEEEIKQMKPTDYFQEKDREIVQEKVQKAFEGNQVSLELELLKKDGTTSPFIFNASRFDMDNEAYLIGTGQDITELKVTQHNLEQSLKEKEVLLAEIHHRVKNNLAVISGLIQLETLDSENTRADKKLLNTMLRIRSMALIHEIMYQTDNFTHVVFDNVIGNIAENIKQTYRGTDGITLSCKTEGITLNVNQAIPCGMIINELLTNAWKHAYPDGEGGTIYINMSENDGVITLRIADNGRGLSENKGPGKSNTMGFILVEQLCNQLKADIDINRQSGTEYAIHFEKKEVKGAGSALSLR